MSRKTPYQERIIRRYYEHHGEIMLQRLSELVGELYLAEGKTRSRLWQRAESAMRQMKIPADRIQHIVNSDNPSLLAGLVKELQAR